jgi:hypothetical protein
MTTEAHVTKRFVTNISWHTMQNHREASSLGQEAEALAHPCLLQHYSQQPSYGNSQDAPLLTNGLRKCGIYTQWNFRQP